MKRLDSSELGGTAGRGAYAQPASASAASNSAVTSIPVDPATQIEMHVTANWCADGPGAYFNTTANLLTPDGPTGFPDDAWARQTITLRSSDRDVWQEAGYSAPSGTPRADKGANHDNVLSKMYKSLNDVEISVTYLRWWTDRALSGRRRLGAHRLENRPAEHARQLHRVLQHPGGLRRSEPHHADRVRADDVQLSGSAALDHSVGATAVTVDIHTFHAHAGQDPSRGKAAG